MNSAPWLVVVTWAIGRQQRTWRRGFWSERAARACIAGHVEQAERNRWDSEIHLFKRHSSADRVDPVYVDVTYERLLPGGPPSSC